MQDTKYFEEKFNRVFDKLDNIQTRVEHTNGTVKEHEARIRILEKADIAHISKCPIAQDVKNINDELLEYRFQKKYPKTMFLMYAVAVLLVVYQVIEAIGLLH